MKKGIYRLLLLLLISFMNKAAGTAQTRPATPPDLSSSDSISLTDTSGNRFLFSGKTAGGDSCRLFWQYSRKPDITYFELERSTDNEHFEPVLLMQAKDAARNVAGYRFTDYDNRSGIHYYRLRVEEKSGKETWLRIVLLPAGGALANK